MSYSAAYRYYLALENTSTDPLLNTPHSIFSKVDLWQLHISSLQLNWSRDSLEKHTVNKIYIHNIT